MSYADHSVCVVLEIWIGNAAPALEVIWSLGADVLRGDIKIAHSRMTKTCWETLVTCW